MTRIATLDSVHTLLHLTFQLGVRDDIIRKNPTDGVMKEIAKISGKNRGIRHDLTVEQQRAFMDYIINHTIKRICADYNSEELLAAKLDNVF